MANVLFGHQLLALVLLYLVLHFLDHKLINFDFLNKFINLGLMLFFELGNKFLGEARINILLARHRLNLCLLFLVRLLLLNLSFVDRKQVFADVLSSLLDIVSTHIAPTLVPILPVYLFQLAIWANFKALNEFFLVRRLEALFESRCVSWKPLLNNALKIIVIAALYASQILNLHFQFLDPGPQFWH